MTTQTYQGEEIKVAVADSTQQATLQELADLDIEIKAFLEEKYSRKEELLNSLPQKTAIVATITKDEESERRTYVVDKPKGKFVSIPDLDLTMNAKTTKKLLKEIGEG